MCPNGPQGTLKTHKQTTESILGIKMSNNTSHSPHISPNVAILNHNFPSYITGLHKDEPMLIYSPNKPHNAPLTTVGKKKDYNNRFVFQRRGSGALQLTGNDKYLYAGPRDGSGDSGSIIPDRDSVEMKHRSSSSAGGWHWTEEQKQKHEPLCRRCAGFLSIKYIYVYL